MIINSFLKRLKSFLKLDNLTSKLDYYFSKDDKEKILILKDKLNHYTNLEDENKLVMTELYESVEDQTAIIQELRNELASVKEKKKLDGELEAYWLNKHQKNNHKKYKARPKYDSDEGNESVDPRIFYQPYNNEYPTFTGSNDEKADKILEWVYNNIKYVTDHKQFKRNETWLFPSETLQLRKGDCEDGAALLASIMLYNEIPSWRVRLNAGSVQLGGHAYTTYLREMNNEWYVLDWCYWYKESRYFKKSWKTAKKYFGIWFSWTKENIYVKDKLDR